MLQVDLPDAVLNVGVEGKGPPLILIAGLGSNYRAWDRVVPYLSKHFTVVRFDNRGIGDSRIKRSPQHLRDYSCDVLGIMNELGYRRCHVLGTSFGGMIAQQVAMDFPDRVDRLVLMSTACQFSPYLKQIMTLLGTLLRRAKKDEYRDALTTLGFSPWFIDEHPEIHRTIRELIPPAKISRRAIASQLRAIANASASGTTLRITIPTLLMGGSHDVIIPFKYVEQIHALIPGSKLVKFEEAGHALMEEYPDLVLPTVRKFLLETDDEDCHKVHLPVRGLEAPKGEDSRRASPDERNHYSLWTTRPHAKPVETT